MNQQKGENDRRKYFMINLHERWLLGVIFSSILQIWYVEVQISWSISGSPFDNESQLYFKMLSAEILPNMLSINISWVSSMPMINIKLTVGFIFSET